MSFEDANYKYKMLDVAVSFSGEEKQVPGCSNLEDMMDEVKKAWPGLSNREFTIEMKDRNDSGMVIVTQGDLDNIILSLGDNKLKCSIMVKGEQQKPQDKLDVGKEDSYEEEVRKEKSIATKVGIENSSSQRSDSQQYASGDQASLETEEDPDPESDRSSELQDSSEQSNQTPYNNNSTKSSQKASAQSLKTTASSEFDEKGSEIIGKVESSLNSQTAQGQVGSRTNELNIQKGGQESSMPGKEPLTELRKQVSWEKEVGLVNKPSRKQQSKRPPSQMHSIQLWESKPTQALSSASPPKQNEGKHENRSSLECNLPHAAVSQIPPPALLEDSNSSFVNSSMDLSFYSLNATESQDYSLQPANNQSSRQSNFHSQEESLAIESRTFEDIEHPNSDNSI